MINLTGSILLCGLLISVGGLAAAELDVAWASGKPWQNLTYSFAAALVVFILTWLMGKTADEINSGIRDWQKKLREKMGVEEGETITEAVWLVIMLQIALWCTLVLGVMVLWGWSEYAARILSRFANTGITVGEINVVPGQLVGGLLVFIFLLAIARWLKSRLENRWLLRTPLDSSTRDTIATLFGYITFIFAILISLNFAGFEFSKLALIAGALGVGIGFGLQGIVANFVAGLTLLFERPIRTGDYITVGSTEGFVRKIRIRSTEIETLDREHVVVPNSELLTNHVVNWTLRDRFGRITVSVGVAYGSDTELVRNLLMEVAENNPSVIQENNRMSLPGPMVLFTGFGDSSLDFELKVHIRDISRRFIVLSELNFAVDKAFRDHGVTIPFPQRDLWFKNTLQNT